MASKKGILLIIMGAFAIAGALIYLLKSSNLSESLITGVAGLGTIAAGFYIIVFEKEREDNKIEIDNIHRYVTKEIEKFRGEIQYFEDKIIPEPKV